MATAPQGGGSPVSRSDADFVVLGSAHLPKALTGGQSSSLLVEIVFDSQERRIINVATTIALPGYVALLRSLLVGRRLEEVDGVTEELSAHLRGPLLRPTLAALTNAVSNSRNTP